MSGMCTVYMRYIMTGEWHSTSRSIVGVSSRSMAVPVQLADCIAITHLHLCIFLILDRVGGL